MLKKAGFLLVLLFIVALPASYAQETGTPFQLTLMHTNDTHANYLPQRDGVGGVARQATAVKQIRAEAKHSLLVDAGDRFTGSVFHSFYQGQDNVRVMNLLGYDAMVLGSYEFTHGPDVLADFVNALNFPVVVSNVDFSAYENLAAIQPYIIRDFDGEQIGIIGVTRGDSRLRPIPDLVFDTDYVGVVQNTIDTLTTQGVNKVILISHLGYFDDLEMATNLNGVDIIVGGDTNTLLSNSLPDAEGAYPTVIDSASGDPVLVVQAWDKTQVMGHLDVTFDADGVLIEWDGDAILLDDSLEPDPDMQALIDDMDSEIGGFLSQTVGENTIYLDGTEEVCRYSECNMGNIITDAMRAATGAQIAFQNGGGIRASIETGTVTVGDVLNVLPFNNTYVIFEVTGIDVIAALENGVSRTDATEGTGRFLQVSGLRYSWDGSQPVGRRVVSVEVMNEDGEYEPLDPDEIYSIATNDYLSVGGDAYDMFANNARNSYDFGRTLDEAVRDYIAQTSPVAAQTEGRIIRIDR
ncbi:MAG: 5'-nucleotidase C-terminal domain-containing protein [Anaerolineales bacterium]|nr:5'-nucleotidase C-terminal domain-containing protein [Anaerolineales bacterium]